MRKKVSTIDTNIHTIYFKRTQIFKRNIPIILTLQILMTQSADQRNSDDQATFFYNFYLQIFIDTIT